MTTEAMCPGFMCLTGSCRGLIEGRNYGFLGKQVTIAAAAGDQSHFISYLEHIKEFVSIKILE
ncbi:MAG: hypothetical protein QGD96_04935 [Anaerolineae bacterium]|nr:hypothetical protein [Anaerolineae bacterium]